MTIMYWIKKSQNNGNTFHIRLDDIIDLHQGFEEIRPKGRYIIVAYILKKKTISVDEYCIYTGT